VAALYLLAQGPENCVEPVPAAEAGRELLANMLFFAEDQGIGSPGVSCRVRLRRPHSSAHASPSRRMREYGDDAMNKNFTSDEARESPPANWATKCWLCPLRDRHCSPSTPPRPFSGRRPMGSQRWMKSVERHICSEFDSDVRRSDARCRSPGRGTVQTRHSS